MKSRSVLKGRISVRQLWGGLGIVVVLLFMVGIDMASAHSLYIQSGRHRVSEGKKTPLFFAYGHHFPVDDGVRANKLDSIKVFRPDGEAVSIAPRAETCLQSQMVEYDVPGTYVLTAETHPGHYTKWVDLKGRNRNSIKPMSAVKDQASKIVKSLYSKQYAKTYVRCGESDGQYLGRVGLPLELVPMQDPTTLKQGNTLILKVFRDGARYTGSGHWDATYGGYSTEAEDLYHPGKDVRGDTFKVSLDQPGKWFIRYFIKTDAPADKKDEYLQSKQTATLVVLVPNERKQPSAKHH
ncbi:DUF4198 domain-containing protein [Pseudodesulfovibrio sp. JC047]|uniref:DUF4198 domain-containing protein n=1 Tax=Pseudodesulfovibrio sp. JC047 TaxID=2683199 RepID=UPI0013D657DA|nr:DUF4198 domain-containing protein [Pseudodesulfovibrio sp. JC047]NDV19061.1 DUF4198 domain-containing protein [Pseudodesulfovibrio sp. JC047]